MKAGNKVKYCKKQIVTILKIEGDHALIQFESGTKICTDLNALSIIQ